VGIDLPHPLNRPFTERTAVSRFREALSGCLLKGTVQQRVLLVIDEIEHVCPDLSPEGHWNSDFLHFWKLLRSVQTSDRRFAFLIVGVNASASERTSIESQDNPLFSLVGSRYVSPFNRRDTKVMVQTLGRYMGMNVTDDGCEYLEERYGGHPMLIRLACSWEHHRLLAEQAERPVSVSREDLQRREDQRDEDQVQYVKHVIEVLRRWYTEEYDLLTALALGDGDTFQEYARTLPESVQHLRAYGLLREPGPTISIAMIQRYLIATCAGALVKARTGELPEAAVGSAAWLDLVQDLGRLRNVLEPKLRRFIRLVLKGQLGAERWIDPVLAVIPKERREKLGGVSRDEILDHKLFLLDLLQIIDANWDRFKHLEGGDAAVRVTKSQFKVLLDYLNVHREDAHAKGIGQAEVAAVMLASQCLDRAISRYFD
jgi:hypothetical protein